MSTSTAVFITSDEARIFEFTTEGVQSKVLRQEGPEHAGTHLDENKFVKEVAKYLINSGSGQWLLLGPGLAKSHLQHHLEAKYPNDASKIAGVAGMNKSTDGQIQDFAHSFFKRRNLYVG